MPSYSKRNLQLFGLSIDLTIQKIMNNLQKKMASSPAVNGLRQAFYEMKAPAESEIVNYDFKTLLGSFEEFKGVVDVEGNDFKRVTLANKKYSKGLSITHEDFINGQDILFIESIASLPNNLMEFEARKMAETIADGENSDSNNIDSYPTFTSDNASGRANIITGTGTTDAQIKADIESARVNLALREVNGRRVPFTYDLILCHPTLENQIKKIIGSSTDVEAQASGILNETFSMKTKVIGVPYFTDINDYYLFDTKDKMQRPFLHIIRDKYRLRFLKDANFDAITHQKKISAFSHQGFTYGIPYGAVKVKNT